MVQTLPRDRTKKYQPISKATGSGISCPDTLPQLCSRTCSPNPYLLASQLCDTMVQSFPLAAGTILQCEEGTQHRLTLVNYTDPSAATPLLHRGTASVFE